MRGASQNQVCLIEIQFRPVHPTNNNNSTAASRRTLSIFTPHHHHPYFARSPSIRRRCSLRAATIADALAAYEPL